jgi:hypothetical protein
MKVFIGAALVLIGIMMVAGSAGDCDGKCMEYANSLGDMMKSVGIGLTMCLLGGIILYGESK